MASKPLTSPVSEDWYPLFSVILIVIGLAFTASFFIYEATTSKRSRSIMKEVGIGGVASVFLGFGSLFLLLSSGVYV